MSSRRYTPGQKPYEAACVLVVRLRLPVGEVGGFLRAGFTLLRKRGLVEVVGGELRPSGTFWDDAERWGLTSDGFATEETRKIEKRHREDLPSPRR